MLCVCKYVVCVKMIHNVFVYDVFKNFANNGCERDGAIIRRVSPVTCLVDGGDVCAKPVVWYGRYLEGLRKNNLEDRGKDRSTGFKEEGWYGVWSSGFSSVERLE